MRAFILLLFILQSPLLFAESFDTVLTSIFKTADGSPATAKGQATDSSKGHLILFWAGWCVPCKEELALVARHGEQLKNWNITAVNVDDSAGRLRADGLLKSFGWEFNSLYDEAGSLFFQINSSGELPLALAFNPDGGLVEVIRELKEPALDRLSQIQFTAGAKAGWEVSEELHYVQRKRPGGTSDVGVNTLAVKYSSDRWQVGAAHNLIRQKQDPRGGWKRFEDEVGISYLQYQTSADGLNRVRLGDETIEWGKGALLSARALPGTEINSSLLGAHANLSRGGYSVQLAAGRVRQQLFGLQLDPTVDLTQDSPTETAFGGVAAKNFKLGGDYTAKLGLGYVQYHRDELAAVSTVYLTPYEDRRAHYNLAFGRKHWGLDLAQTHYDIDQSQKAGQKQSVATQVDGFVHSLPDSRWQLGATYLEKKDDLPRVFTPVLTEYPALPLTTDGTRSWRLAPRANLGKWVYEPLYIGEESTRKSDYENQNTYGVSVLKPEMQFKTVLLYQRHGSNSLDIDSDYRAGVIASEFSEILSGQFEYKGYDAKGRDGATASDQKGQSLAAQLSVKIEKLTKATKLGQMLLSVTRTHQDGYFFATSGITEKHLMGYRLTWTLANFELRAAAGQEPGGLVCSGGVCAQRPPLDGFAVEGKMRWQF